MFKITQILIFMNVIVLTFFLNMADVSSGSYIVQSLENLAYPRAEGLPAILFEDTNPLKVQKIIKRGLASDEINNSEANKKREEEKKKKGEEGESYSLLDPNLYEDDSGGASDLLQINQINNSLNQ